MSDTPVNDGDPSEPDAAASVPQPGDRRRFYMDGNRLESTLWAVGYRLCDRCGSLTIHRLMCLKCDPSGVSRIEPEPQEDVA